MNTLYLNVQFSFQKGNTIPKGIVSIHMQLANHADSYLNP